MQPGKDSEFVVIDAGQKYPGKESPGVDYQIADAKILNQVKSKITALVLTNAHERHSGAAMHYVNKLGIKKVIGSSFAILTLKQRLSDKKIKEVEWINFEPRVPVECGNFTFHPFTITNCIDDTYALIIESHDQRIFYSGTFKLDQTPSNGIKSDVSGISMMATELYDQGKQIDLMLSSSSGVETEGYSKSELPLIPKFKKLLKETKARVIINTYSSNTIRLQNLVRVAKECGRKVVLLNKDIRQVFRAMKEAGLLEDDIDGSGEDFINVTELDKFADEQLLILMTAPQGEALQELERVAFDKSLELQIKKGDVVVNSADFPPGTMRVMAQISDQFFLKEASIIGGPKVGLDVETCALTEEMKFLFNLIRPKFFLPAFGETRQLIRHAKLAVDAGQDAASIFILDNGDLVDISGHDI